MSQTTYTSDLSADGVGALVSAADHHLVDNNLLSAQDDSIAADDANNCATEVKKYTQCQSNHLTKKKKGADDDDADINLPRSFDGLLGVFNLEDATFGTQRTALVVELFGEKEKKQCD